MYTSDKWTLGSAPVGGYINETVCMVDAGFGTTETGVDKCLVGFYNAGQNRDPCTACPNGYTTLADSQDALTDCAIKAGWFFNSVASLCLLPATRAPGALVEYYYPRAHQLQFMSDWLLHPGAGSLMPQQTVLVSVD